MIGKGKLVGLFFCMLMFSWAAGAPQPAFSYWVNLNDFDDTSMVMYGGIDPWGTDQGKTCEIRARINDSSNSGAQFWPLQLAVRFGGNRWIEVRIQDNGLVKYDNHRAARYDVDLTNIGGTLDTTQWHVYRFHQLSEGEFGSSENQRYWNFTIDGVWCDDNDQGDGGANVGSLEEIRWGTGERDVTRMIDWDIDYIYLADQNFMPGSDTATVNWDYKYEAVQHPTSMGSVWVGPDLGGTPTQWIVRNGGEGASVTVTMQSDEPTATPTDTGLPTNTPTDTLAPTETPDWSWDLAYYGDTVPESEGWTVGEDLTPIQSTPPAMVRTEGMVTFLRLTDDPDDSDSHNGKNYKATKFVGLPDAPTSTGHTVEFRARWVYDFSYAHGNWLVSSQTDFGRGRAWSVSSSNAHGLGNSTRSPFSPPVSSPGDWHLYRMVFNNADNNVCYHADSDSTRRLLLTAADAGPAYALPGQAHFGTGRHSNGPTGVWDLDYILVSNDGPFGLQPDGSNDWWEPAESPTPVPTFTPTDTPIPPTDTPTDTPVVLTNTPTDTPDWSWDLAYYGENMPELEAWGGYDDCTPNQATPAEQILTEGMAIFLRLSDYRKGNSVKRTKWIGIPGPASLPTMTGHTIEFRARGPGFTYGAGNFLASSQTDDGLGRGWTVDPSNAYGVRSTKEPFVPVLPNTGDWHLYRMVFYNAATPTMNYFVDGSPLSYLEMEVFDAGPAYAQQGEIHFGTGRHSNGPRNGHWDLDYILASNDGPFGYQDDGTNDWWSPAESPTPVPTLTPTGQKGDLEPDGDWDLFDVLRSVDIVLDIPPLPSAYEQWAADMDDDLDIDLFDILAIVDKVLET